MNKWSWIREAFNIQDGEWVGFDLDGTLSDDTDRKKRINKSEIGPPVQNIIDLAKALIENGIEVRCLTARANTPEMVPYVRKWLDEQGLFSMSITGMKDLNMALLLDDKARQVVRSTGEIKWGSDSKFINKSLREMSMVEREEYIAIEKDRISKGNYKDDELIYSATNRCKCGAGLAYPKRSVAHMYGAWICSVVLKNPTEISGPSNLHQAFSFSMYEIKSENQPSAKGTTTRETL